MKKLTFLFLIFIISITPIANAELMPRDFITEVSKGNVPGHELVHKSAQNPDITNTWECLWENGTAYVWPPTAIRMNVSSDNVADAVSVGEWSGGGAWNVTIVGLDTNWAEISETVQLNGQNNVTTTNSYLRINHFYVVEANQSAGLTGTNVGNIFIGTGALVGGVPPTVYGQIGVSGGIGHGRALASMYAVPVNHTIFVISLFYSSDEDKEINFALRYRPFGEAWKFRDYQHVYRTDVVLTPQHPIRFEGRTDISICALGNVNASSVSGGYDLLVVEDEYLSESILDWSDGEVSYVVARDPTVLYAVLIGMIVMALFNVASRRG